MNKENLKTLMVENKVFLRSLFLEGSYLKKKKLLIQSEEKQADLILNLLFLVVQGEIPIKKIFFEKLRANKKLHLINKALNTEEKLNLFLKLSYKEKITFLLKLLKSYNEIFYLIFKND